MSKLMKNSILALAASLTLIAVSTPNVHASQPKALLLNPQHGSDCYLPQFGFNSYNIGGFGERITHVRWGGLAAQMGLEPGDTVLSMNGFPLTYHGSWNDALLSAMQNGGLVQLTIRDVRTGWIANRQLFLGNGGGYGPVTPKYQVTQYGPNTSHVIIGNQGGPITTKKMVGPHNNNNVSLNEVIKMFKD